MPVSQDDFKSQVLAEVTAAFQSGCGATPISAEAEQGMLEYWSGRFDLHADEIRKKWSDKRDLALDKVRRMGEVAAGGISEAEVSKGTKIEMGDFARAREQVNSSYYATTWC